jgi:hypothetical protein
VRKAAPHGHHRYKYYKCRCTVCRAANAAYQQKMAKKLSKVEPPKHGLSGYTNYRCRCDVCIDAHAEYCREYKLRKKRERQA